MCDPGKALEEWDGRVREALYGLTWHVGCFIGERGAEWLMGA